MERLYLACNHYSELGGGFQTSNECPTCFWRRVSEWYELESEKAIRIGTPPVSGQSGQTSK